MRYLALPVPLNLSRFQMGELASDSAPRADGLGALMHIESRPYPMPSAMAVVQPLAPEGGPCQGVQSQPWGALWKDGSV